MKLLITGSAGFIGHALTQRLCENNDYGCQIVAIDNINDYYDPKLKLARLSQLGISSNPNNQGESISDNFPWHEPIVSSKFPNLTFIRTDISDSDRMDILFSKERFDYVIHLAAQAGVRYSLTNPRAYLTSNIDGFLNLLEGCRTTGVKHLVYASSSSVYGLNGKTPFSEHHSTEHPVSLYAATKKSNELMAHTYSYLYGLPMTGLRFFTVYGPWGRPDMSPYLFIDAILHERPIKVFNNGDMERDFTYIDNIVESIIRIAGIIPKGDSTWNPENPDPASSPAPYKIYNIGNSSPVNLMDYISCIETVTGKKALKVLEPMQPGDVYRTFSDSSELANLIGYKPLTKLEDGIRKTVEWFKNFYKITP